MVQAECPNCKTRVQLPAKLYEWAECPGCKGPIRLEELTPPRLSWGGRGSASPPPADDEQGEDR